MFLLGANMILGFAAKRSKFGVGGCCRRVIQSSPPVACLASFDLRKCGQIVRFVPAKIN